MYDYLIVGSGLFGSVFAHEVTKRNKRCLVVEKRNHVGGNVYCENHEGIVVHKYGAHIFHTSDSEVWAYMNGMSKFNSFINSPVANYKGKIYSLPFNMNTFAQMWGIVTPQQAIEKIEAQRSVITGKPKNLEEQAISMVGTDIYETLIKGYSEKQWGRPCSELPPSIIRRLPVRYTYDNNYFNDRYQGIPEGGYGKIIDKLLDGIEIMLNTDFLKECDLLSGMARKVIYTGSIDAYFDYCFGELSYRSLRFETLRINTVNFQGIAVMNYTDKETPYTRVIEHKHFEFGQQSVTYVTYEYPTEWIRGSEAYYPVNDTESCKLYEKYVDLAKNKKNVLFGGRLGAYKYYDMDKVVRSSLNLVKKELYERV